AHDTARTHRPVRRAPARRARTGRANLRRRRLRHVPGMGLGVVAALPGDRRHPLPGSKGRSHGDERGRLSRSLLGDIAVPPKDAHMLRDLETIVLTAADVYSLVVKIPFT